MNWKASRRVSMYQLDETIAGLFAETIVIRQILDTRAFDYLCPSKSFISYGTFIQIWMRAKRHNVEVFLRRIILSSYLVSI